MLSQLIQRQVPIGSKVCFSLKDGREIQGILIEIGRNHVSIENDSGTITIIIEMIGACNVINANAPQSDPRSSTSPEKMPDGAVTQITTPKSSEFSLLSDQATAKRLLEIEARFQAQSQVSSIRAKAPDFVFPANEFKGKQSKDASVIWSRVKDKYSYAEKINELSVKFGRFNP